uniref:ABC transporter related n=1 Tax=Cyanothece sp. (strain PCC 7425 / ATCC 29141) TaxID=395961 RepID=B8HXH1_CYAP4
MAVISSDPFTRAKDSGDDVILAVENVSKRFCRNLKYAYVYGLRDIGAEILGIRQESDNIRKHEFWALRDINFAVKRGESIGLIGANGSGKTTLLRIIGGLFKPDRGRVRIKGRVAALIALGAGFNPVLTGRENVFINMSILGLSKREIQKKFEEVIDFADVWDAIDSPVRTYSSGMQARLGFACAIHTEPDVLLIDEVLSVGDARFRAKCYRKLADLRQNGTSFILVSHSANAVLNICDTAVYLSKGQLILWDNSQDVMQRYEADLLAASKQDLQQHPRPAKANNPDSELLISSVVLRDGEDGSIPYLYSGHAGKISLLCEARRSLENVNVSLVIRELTGDNTTVLSLDSLRDDQITLSVPMGQSEIQFVLPYCGLKPGLYNAKLCLNTKPYYVYDLYDHFRFEVKPGASIVQSEYYQPRQWQVVSPKH